jgi:hypothetical protein
MGLRNPWRFSFDRVAGDLYITDVGLDSREEINVERAGGAGGRNYGWRCLEGTRCTGFEAPCSCDDPDLTAPTYEIERPGGCWALVGGFVYRGCNVPALHGRYVYGNYCDGAVYSLRVSRGADGAVILHEQREHTQDLAANNALLTTFGEDARGELYFASIFGSLWRIDPAPDCNGNGTIDRVDIDSGSSEDCNDNGVPDECETGNDANGDGVPDDCQLDPDITGDGVVNVDDLLAVITGWGACPEPPAGCPADVDRDGVVGVDDLMLVILNWG